MYQQQQQPEAGQGVRQGSGQGAGTETEIVAQELGIFTVTVTVGKKTSSAFFEDNRLSLPQRRLIALYSRGRRTKM